MPENDGSGALCKRWSTGKGQGITVDISELTARDGIDVRSKT